MKSLWARLKRKINMTSAQFKVDRRFSLRLAVLRLSDDLCHRFRMEGAAKRLHDAVDKCILEYLSGAVGQTISKYKDCDDVGVFTENAPVWVCWWTGEESAPPLVRQCIRSIRNSAGTHPVHLITQDNCSSYLDIPGFIIDRVKDGRMCIANFTDYLRVSLICKYGGLWLDSTIFCSAQIPEVYFEAPLFTCKSAWRESRYISHYQWTSFCLGGRKGNVFFSFFKEAFEEYWAKHDSAIDYLLVDYLIYLGKENIPAVRRSFDDVPINNPHRDDLQAAMNAALPSAEFWNIIKEDTPIYKLSWRETYAETAADGSDTVYKCFLNMEFQQDR